ncbi:MAG: glucoamylase family protein [Candidatus Acidiferrum sp.]
MPRRNHWTSAGKEMAENPMMTRRELIRIGGLGLFLAPLENVLRHRGIQQESVKPPKGFPYQGTNDQLLDEMQRTSFDFFWNEASARTGQVKDRSLVNGNDTRTMSSIAATGFGLSSLCIGDYRGYGKKAEIAERVRSTLRFLASDLRNEHGFFYHFIHIETGQRWEKCEISSIDTSLLLCGVLTARQHFADQEIKDLATKIYERVDWPWMLNGGAAFSMGWKPETGFLKGRWNHYCELMMICLLGIGSPTHPVSRESWNAWTRPVIEYQGIEYISGNDPLFTHQYSQAWFDFRRKRDAYANYFENSIKATKAHKLFCLSLHDRFPDYSDDLWGITSSDSAKGYTAWGGPPPQGPIDGSIVPCATGGSLAFLYDDCMRVLRNIRGRYGENAWGRYGFVDAFNPLTGWHDEDVLGIDLGITMLMAENHRTSFVWDTFMKNPEARSAMQKAGFQPE